MRTRGKSLPSACLAAARQAMSVSAADSTTMSPGVCARSTAAVSSTVPGVAARRRMSAEGGGADRRLDRGPVEAGATDDDERTPFVRPPGAVEVALEAVADALDHEPALAGGHAREALDAKHVVLGR